MATNKTDERSRIVGWFEEDFRESARKTTKTFRLEDGRIDYSFSVLNSSGFDFSNFSFSVKILNKANQEEVGTAVINAGKWSNGQNKNFKTKLTVPAGVRSLTFVMFSDSVDYEIQEEPDKKEDSPTLAEAIQGFGKSLNEAGINKEFLGELFSNGGMPEGTTTTKTTTVTIGDKTTTTQTINHSKPEPKPQSKPKSKPRPRSSGSVGSVGHYARKKQEKKMDKLRMGKSGKFVTFMVIGIIFLITAFSSDVADNERIQYLVIGGVSVLVGVIVKMYSLSRGKRIREYEVKVKKNGNTSLYQLSIEMGRPVSKVVDDLHKMIMQGFFPEAYIDSDNGLLVMTRDGKPIESVEKSAEESKKARRIAARERGKLPESLEDLITMTDDVDIKKKLRELKDLSDRIDARVQERADLVEQVKDFREKFFPEVVRLTDDYNGKIASLASEKKKEKSETEIEIDASPNYLTEQALKIKEQLLSLMDSVLEASENLIERLHEGDIMDITTDIQMLQTTLASKGLLDSDFDIK